MGDDIVLYKDDSRRDELARLPMLRQQEVIADGRPNRSLADFIAPKESLASPITSACSPSPPASAPTNWRSSSRRSLDDYNAIMVKALADRLAEAFAEYLHAQARKDWGYGAEEKLTAEDLVAEKYRGIRPAYGYPACPDHSEKFKLFDLLDARKVGHQPDRERRDDARGVGVGLYFSHPEAKYFNVGRIGRDQLEDYARRKGEALEVTERWLSSQPGVRAGGVQREVLRLNKSPGDQKNI